MLNELKDARGIRIMTVLRMLGIAHTKDTPVGDSMLRGVSGGERKRVTIGEMIVGGRNVFMLDEISTGLDSATLYNIVNT
jgi:ABC-type multidrug transport system ATPase subunit